MTTPGRRRYIPGDVQAQIEELTDQGYSPKQIEDLLSRDGKFAGRLPTLRTIQRVVADRVRADDSSPWEIGPADDVDGQVALDVLADVTSWTKGRKSSLTRTEAKWVTSLARLALDVPAYELYVLARSYIVARARKESTRDLDLFLAYQPWRDEWCHFTYLCDALLGVVPAVSVSIWAALVLPKRFPPFDVVTWPGIGSQLFVMGGGINDEERAVIEEHGYTPVRNTDEAADFMFLLRNWALDQPSHPPLPGFGAEMLARPITDFRELTKLIKTSMEQPTLRLLQWEREQADGTQT